MKNKLYNYHQELLNYEGTTLCKNLLKHANAPKIPTQKHPHKKYHDKTKIKIKLLDPELQKLAKMLDPTSKDPEVLNHITPDMLTCNCPHKDKFTKILDTTVNDADEAMVWTACRHTTYAAARRQMKAAPTPDEAVAEDFVNHSIKLIEKEIGDDLTHFGYSVTDWYNHLNTKKQKAIEPVMKYYRGDASQLTKHELESINNLHYTGILKEEEQPTDGKPRMVCSIPQRTKFAMGPITWQLEEICTKKLKGYCGGKNLTEMSEEINELLAQGFTKIVEGDGSAFDNTQDVSLKAIDRYIYKRIADKVYHVPHEDFDRVAQSLYKTMDIEYIDGKKKKPLLSYTILGTVFSGDCDTTLMNTLRMVMYNRYVNDKAGWIYGKDYVCFSKGDDFTVLYKPYITNKQIEEAYYRYFLPACADPSNPDTRIFGIGQVLKFLTFGDATNFRFCSLRSWYIDPSETQIILTRDPAKFFTLAKYSRKAKFKPPDYMVAYHLAQAQSIEQSYKGIRLFDAMASAYVQEAKYIMHRYDVSWRKVNKYLKQICPSMIIDSRVVHIDPTLIQTFEYLTKLELQHKELIKHREMQYKITDNYWHTMQRLERVHTKTLTEEQAKYVSLEMEWEFFSEYIKAMTRIGA